MASALEQELRTWLYSLRGSVSAHDRGVFLGFGLSLVPVAPVALMGLVICMFNLRLIKAKKLPFFELAMVRKGIVLSVVNIIVGSVGLYFLITTALAFDFSSFIPPFLRSLARPTVWL